MSALQDTQDPKKENFSKLTDKAFYELAIAKTEMEEKETLLKELADQSNKRFGEELKINKDVKEKIQFLQELSVSLSKKNEDLERKNKLLEQQKTQNTKLTEDLRKTLEKVVLKEKELELERNFLSRRVDEKSEELIKAEKLSVIGELASRMAHDLRNPLSTIKNVVEIIETKPRMKIEEKLVYYGKLRRAIDRISHQVDDVLDFVRTSKIDLKPHSIHELLDVAKNGIVLPNDIKLNVEHNDVTINCDFRKMEAVFTNLIINAIQSVGNTGTINVRIIDNGNDVIVAIEDSGPGIANEAMGKIFDPLFTTKQSGIGLGLAICKNIVEQHGGNITVKNNPTTFLVRLPKNS